MEMIKLTINECSEDPSKARPVYFVARNIADFFANLDKKGTFVDTVGGQSFTVQESPDYICTVLEQCQ